MNLTSLYLKIKAYLKARNTALIGLNLKCSNIDTNKKLNEKLTEIFELKTIF